MPTDNISMISELVFDAREAITGESEFSTRPPSDVTDWSVRSRTPEAVKRVELDTEGGELEFLAGTIALLRGEAESSLLAEFETATVAGDGERSLEIYEQLKADVESASEFEPRTSDAELIYDGTPVVEGVATSPDGTFAAGFASYNGGDLDSTQFEIRESAAPEADTSYEYRVLIIPPTRSEAEREAEQTTPEGLSEPVLRASSNPTAACLWIAVGALAAVALLGGGQAADPGLGPQDTSPSADVGSSVSELIEARSHL